MAGPTKLTPTMHRMIVGFRRMGASMESAAQAAGISSVTVGIWLRKGREGDAVQPYKRFATAMDKGKKLAIMRHLKTVDKLSEKGNPNVRLRAATWALERLDPKQFGTNARLQIEIQAQVDEVLDAVEQHADPETLERILTAITVRESPDALGEGEADQGPEDNSRVH